MGTILFGSISTLADTSEVQRESFNEAFGEFGLDWAWDRDTYVAARGQTVDASAVHAVKSRIFRQKLLSAPLTARPGVVDTIRAGRRRRDKVGFVTTTSPDNVDAVLDALGPEISRADFDVVIDR